MSSGDINAMRIQLAVAALVNSVFITVQANMAAGEPNKHGHTFYQLVITLNSF